MDIKFVYALCLVYGNYRAAIAVVDDAGRGVDALVNVIATGKALLALQEALKVEVADTEQVEIAIDSARQAFLEN